MATLDAETYEEINSSIEKWRQGDCVLGEQWFLHRTDFQAPLIFKGEEAVADGSDLAEYEVLGFMVTTQTCDLVRGCRKRPFVQASPLIKVKASELREIERGKRPNYAFIPGLKEKSLVADLDLVMTIEKGVLAKWKRVDGCRSDDEVRCLSLALVRKHTRVAFPDDFVDSRKGFVIPLQKKISAKHDKNNLEGRALRALREIRVRAIPSWDAEEVDLLFYFIHKEGEEKFEGKGWPSHKEGWLKLIPESGRFVSVAGIVGALGEITASEYLESEVLDLGYLSSRPK